MTRHEDLPLTSSHWGTYRARVSNGRVQELRVFEQDSDPSPTGPGILDVQHGPTRVDTPMVRQSWLDHGPGTRIDRRGTDPFFEISWNKANRLVADELNRLRRDHGNVAIFGGSKFTYSFSAVEAMVPHILGSFHDYLDTCTSCWEMIRDYTLLFVCFGGVPLKNGQGGTGCHSWVRLDCPAGTLALVTAR